MIQGYKLLANLKNVVDRAPITADIFLTNFCNNHCGYCAYGRWGELKKDKRYMSFEDFKKYAGILLRMGVKGFILTGGGEPTINPDFDRITGYLEEQKIPYGINTNFNVLKKIRPVYLKVSVDASDREEYKKIRGVDKFQDVYKNLVAYREWQKGKEVPTKLGLQCVVKSAEQAERFYNTFRDVDVDFIVFRPVESICGGYYAKPSCETADIIETVGNLQLEDSRVVKNYKWDFLDRGFSRCFAAFAQIAVDERGNVCYCCHKPYEIVGKLTDPDILQKKAAYCSDMRKCDVPCRMTGPNTWMRQLEEMEMESDKGFI